MVVKKIDKYKRKPCEYGFKIKHKLLEKGMPQTALARMIGINPTYLCDIVYGNRSAGKYEPAINEFLNS